jgi:hypothetical protein
MPHSGWFMPIESGVAYQYRKKSSGTVIAQFMVEQAAIVCVDIPVQSRRNGS